MLGELRAVLGFGMIAVFGFLTFKNIRSRSYFWCVISGIGLLLGMASVWVEYDKRTNLRAYAAESSASSASNPWAKDS